MKKLGELHPLGGGDTIPLLKEELIVGRSDICDVILRFSNISGKHCRLVLSYGYWYVQDLGSTNGIRVNGVKVKDRRLDPEAKLMIAKQAYQIKYDPSQNGALGVPPPETLGSNDIFSTSLMEKVGLKRQQASPTEELPPSPNEEDDEEKPSEKPAPSPSAISRPAEHRNFFDELVFD